MKLKLFDPSWVIIVLFGFLLSGCSMLCPKPEQVVVEKVVYKVSDIPEHLLAKVKPSAPPAVGLYTNAAWSDKEDMLVVYTNSLLGSLNTCNNRLQDINTLQVKNKAIYENGNNQNEKKN